MQELNAILDAWRSLGSAAREAVLATVVHVKGSAYRRPGARMLLIPGGRRIGSISGGCLEGEISRKAWWFTESGRPALRIYDTSSDDDAVWEFGLGCNGVVHVMLERVASPAVQAMFEFLDECRRADVACVVATDIITGERRMLRDGDPSLQGHMLEAACTRQSRFLHGEQSDLFVEWIGKPPSLVVFGAGHDAIPLVRFASQLGWRVTVADGRPAYASRERFPEASRVVVLAPGQGLAGIPIDADTSVAMMTHNYPLDKRLLPSIVARSPRYLGLLGPKTRADRLFDELGMERPAYVHAPVGLDIGSDNPESIALSIAAEVQAALSNRAGGKLNGRARPIHAPALEFGAGRRELEHARPSYCETTVGNHA